MNNYKIEIHPKGDKFVGYITSNDEIVFTTPEYALTSLVSESITEYLSNVQRGQDQGVTVMAVAPAVFVSSDGTTSVEQHQPFSAGSSVDPSFVAPYSNPAPQEPIRKCCGRG
jgi:hypothetical protein